MTTTQGATRRLELLLARTPDMECADDLRVVLADAVLSRRLLDDARAQKPTAWRPKFDIEGDWSLGEPSIESIEYWHGQGLEIEYAYLRAAPVPAQPAPETAGDARDAVTEAMLVAALKEADPLGQLVDWDESKDCVTRKQMRRILEAAILAKGDAT